MNLQAIAKACPAKFHRSNLLLVIGFVGLSLTDLYLTWRLIEGSDGLVYEANPLAGSILTLHGWEGVSWFKVLSTLIATVLGLVVLSARPRLGRLLFASAYVGLLVVVGYSSYLLTVQPWCQEEEHGTLLEERSRANLLEEELEESMLYSRKLQQVGRDLADRRVSLAGGVEDVLFYLKQRDYDPLAALQKQYRGYPLKACISLTLLRHTRAQLDDRPDLAPHRLQSLTREFEKTYRRKVPPTIRELAAPPEASSLDSLEAAIQGAGNPAQCGPGASD